MPDVKTYLLFRKTKPFLLKRLFPVSLIWASVVLVYWALTSGLGLFLAKEERQSLELTSLTNFADGRVVAILFFGVMVIMGVFTVLMLNVSHDANDRNRMTLFFYDLLDEVSSASTHVGAALVAAIVHQAVASPFGLYWDRPGRLRAIAALAYICIGWLAFRHSEIAAASKKSGDSPTP